MYTEYCCGCCCSVRCYTAAVAAACGCSPSYTCHARLLALHTNNTVVFIVILLTANLFITNENIFVHPLAYTSAFVRPRFTYVILL